MLDCSRIKVTICIMLDRGRKKLGGFWIKMVKKSEKSEKISGPKSIGNAYIWWSLAVGKTAAYFNISEFSSEYVLMIDRCRKKSDSVSTCRWRLNFVIFGVKRGERIFDNFLSHLNFDAQFLRVKHIFFRLPYFQWTCHAWKSSFLTIFCQIWILAPKF